MQQKKGMDYLLGYLRLKKLIKIKILKNKCKVNILHRLPNENRVNNKLLCTQSVLMGSDDSMQLRMMNNQNNTSLLKLTFEFVDLCLLKA